MKRQALFSRATRSRRADGARWPAVADGAQSSAHSRDDAESLELHGPSAAARATGWLKTYYLRHERPATLVASVLIALLIVSLHSWLHPPPRALTQRDIDGAVEYTLAHTPPGPADTARAAAIIAPAVVEVEGFLSPEHAAQLDAKSAKPPHAASPDKTAPTRLPEHPLADAHPKDAPTDEPDAIGSGVVMDQSGKILTALHVVAGTDRWVVVFADGSQSDADLVGSQPENDLAVLQPKHLPDELQPATLASTAGLRPGDQVVATGFPFGIGPSVSAGVVSGLKREFVDPDNSRVKLTNLIQFDAAVNPGNSGGPLVNRDGEVVGIVTAIVNPSGARVFAGIGFAVPIENAARAIGDNPL